MNAFQVRIGQRGAPRLSFPVMAPDSEKAFAQHADLAEIDERVEVERIAAAVSANVGKADRAEQRRQSMAMNLQIDAEIRNERWNTGGGL